MKESVRGRDRVRMRARASDSICVCVSLSLSRSLSRSRSLSSCLSLRVSLCRRLCLSLFMLARSLWPGSVVQLCRDTFIRHCDLTYSSQNKTVTAIVSYCNTLQHTATHCNTLQHTSRRDAFMNEEDCCGNRLARQTLQYVATHCSELQDALRRNSS